MHLDRTDMSFRKGDEEHLLKKDTVTVFRPGNRIYPENRWYISWEVVKARIIEVPWDDETQRPPTFSRVVELVKIKAIKLLWIGDLEKNHFQDSLGYIRSKEDLIEHLERIYKKKGFNLLTKISMEKLETNNLVDNSNEIRELFDSWVMKFALLPERNVANIEELLSTRNFSITFINHDYAWITPKMWNHISDVYNLDIKSAMVIIKPEDFERCLQVLRKNNKFIGWWLGVWFKDQWWKLLSEQRYGFVNPVANEMQSTNFIAHFWDEIHGYNSDASWYVDSLCDKFREIWEDIGKKDIIILWAWWTARWIALELVNRWVNSVTILNRTREKADYIADRLNNVRVGAAFSWDESMIFELKNRKIDAIINLSTKWADWDLSVYSWLTPTEWGLDKNLRDTKMLLREIRSNNSNVIISDINLTKTKTTPLLDEARKIWLNTLDWKLMVVYQWVQAIWTVFWDKIIKTGWTKEQIQEELLKLVS